MVVLLSVVLPVLVAAVSVPDGLQAVGSAVRLSRTYSTEYR
jgi:hypothetical protein